MSMKTQKIINFLKEASDPTNNASEIEREKAWMLLNQILKQKNIHIPQDNVDEQSPAEKLDYTKKRLSEIKAGLALSVKSGVATKTIH